MESENEAVREDHNVFRELAAWATSNLLTATELEELRGHSQTCETCGEIYRQYLILGREGMPWLAAQYFNEEEPEAWNDTLVRKRVFDRIRTQQEQALSERDCQSQLALRTHSLSGVLFTTFPLAYAALLVCLVGAVGFVAYRLASNKLTGAKQSQLFADRRSQDLLKEKQQYLNKLERLLDAQTRNVSRLEHQQSLKEQELSALRAIVRRREEDVNRPVTANTVSQEEAKGVTQQRDKLNAQLRDAEQSYQSAEAEIASLRSELEEALVRSAALESKMTEISIAARNQEQRLSNDEQYLASDRDIRELMGARKLYIADVFDVDSHSRTRRPFGRVFYTQGKSLIFYAFDLDGQADVTNANAFQVWGRKVTEQAKPLNLGILYMDSESNRRWVLRFDDPKQLAEIDAVFVTVEPRGGSQKPTGRPFLYALLRKEANHP